MAEIVKRIKKNTYENVLEVKLMEEHHDIESKEGYELGTWAFLRTGWWILHLVAIALIFYLGYLYGARIF